MWGVSENRMNKFICLIQVGKNIITNDGITVDVAEYKIIKKKLKNWMMHKWKILILMNLVKV